jgi:2-keto-3-deoxy-L-rhamnonate aldolase RhmA
MSRLIGAVAAGAALLSFMPLAAQAQDPPGGRPPTQSMTINGPTTWPNWGQQQGAWYAPPDGRIAQDWVYGNRFDNPEHVIWNEAKRRMLAGEDVMSFTASRGWTPERYCETAAAGYDFAFVNIQHQALDVWQVADMYAGCGLVPAPGDHGTFFSHGARIPDSSERWIQAILDAGAMTLVVPTVDTKEEAEQIVHWALFPPLGARSSGGGLISTLYPDVPGGYRNSFNDNILIIAMIETLEGVENAYEIASVPGIDAVFAASGDLGNFSGYGEGDEAYEWLVQRVVDAAVAAGKPVCGPDDWHYARNADNPMRVQQHFTCFQGGSNPAEDLAERK